MAWLLVLQTLYYFLPAYIGNMSPVIFKKINPMPTPVDNDKKWRGKRIFGAHKTWGGLALAVTFGTLTFWIQKNIGITSLELIPYQKTTILLGVYLSLGAILGDLAKSFIKRRIGKKPGEKWLIADQLDELIGGLLLSSLIFVPPLKTILTLLILTPPLSLATNWIGYKLKLKNHPW